MTPSVRLAPGIDRGELGRVFTLRLLAQGDILISHEMVPAVTNEPERPEARLTARETDVLRALGRVLSPHTVKIHVRLVLAKMEFRNRQQAAAYAAVKGLV